MKTYDFRLKESPVSQENKPGDTIILLHFINHNLSDFFFSKSSTVGRRMRKHATQRETSRDGG